MQGKGGKTGEGGGGKADKAESGKEKSSDKQAEEGKQQTPGQKTESRKGQPSGQSGKGKAGQPGQGKAGQSGKGKGGGESQGVVRRPASHRRVAATATRKNRKGDRAKANSKNKNPARQRIKQAQKDMEQAKKDLDDAQRDGAVKKEEDAIKKLEEAKAALEEILRQLREEEIGRILAMLEARFKKMLEMEKEVYAGTLLLDKVPTAERTHNDEIESGRLSGKQSQIVVEVDKVALVLREEGSAVAFPEAVDQMRDDMQQVVQRWPRPKWARSRRVLRRTSLPR